MATTAEVAAMRRALALAASPQVPHGPNPRVGAVLLDPRAGVVGEGYHAGAGSPHAEVVALAAAGARAAGATLVVTLEPCDHTGRTPPCTAAVLAAGVARVVYAAADAAPPAAGGGARLAAAGVDVESGVLADEADALNPAFAFSARAARPYVTWKLAATLDGRVAAPDGTSRWLTGAPARADVHRLRASVDAVAVGTGTVVADDPALTVRGDDGTPASTQPLRVVIGTRSLPPGARVLDDQAATAVLATRDVTGALTQLRSQGVRHLLLEGGPTLAGAFVDARAVDRVVAYLAPGLLGAGSPALARPGVTTLAQTLRLRGGDVASVGDDVRWESYPDYATPWEV